MAGNPYLPIDIAINSGGVIVNAWQAYFLALTGQIVTLTTIIDAVPGVNTFTVATQPALGPGDTGFLGFVSDYNHTVVWDGAAWQFWGGDNNGYFADQAIIPQSPGWQLCDGTVTAYLTLGATLTTTSFTTPNLIGSPAYKKAAAAYTGTINAKSGSTATGTTGTNTTGTGTTGTGTTGATDVSGTTNADGASVGIGVTLGGSTITVNVPSHTHTFDAGTHTHTVPGLSVPGLSVPGLSVPALGVGTIEMANLGVLPYFRR